MLLLAQTTQQSVTNRIDLTDVLLLYKQGTTIAPLLTLPGYSFRLLLPVPVRIYVFVFVCSLCSYVRCDLWPAALGPRKLEFIPKGKGRLDLPLEFLSLTSVGS